MATLNDKYSETIAYRCFRHFHDHFFVSSNLEAVLKECRDFYSGKHYIQTEINDLPKPTFNICREYVEKVSAKLLETQYTVTFISDVDTINLQDLDNFYEYQMKEIDDDDITSQIAKTAIIDGTAVCFSAFDADTMGIPSLFKGFIKRQIIPIEQVFVENPYCDDIQDQQYLGYYFLMEIGAVKKLVEGREKKEIDELIVPENYFENRAYYDNMGHDLDNELVNVYVRFFRIEGEVAFEMATKYCDIYEHPHALNPKINERILKLKKQEYIKKTEKELAEYTQDKKILDYELDDAKYTLFTKAVKYSEEDYKKSKSKFYRYPVSVFKPYPIVGSFYGESGLSLIIANQKIINYIFLLIILIMQSHAMPKILTKDGALKGQEYDNSPNQILVDYTPVTSGVNWGITRLSSGDAVNSNLIEIGTNIIKLTRNIHGFDDLISNVSNDTSGYAYQQVVQQANLTLIQPQKRLWKYIKDNARTDILYFKHYVPSAKYYVKKSEAEVALNEEYRNLSQNLIDSGNIQGEEGTILPPTKTIEVKDVTDEMFDADFNVAIDVEQGIAGSQISESQHYQQVFQYIAAGNLDADKIKLLVTNDPSFSAKTRQRILTSLEALENSQLQMKNAEIAKLQEIIQELIQNLKTQNENMNYLKMRDQAREKSLKESIDENKAFLETMQSQPTMSEGEVKAMNAKGIEGGSFTS